VIDEDDATMVTAEVLQRLCALGCTITVGSHRSKIEAVNAGRVSDWDVLLLASDDMVPIVDGYAVRVLDAMEEHFPHLDGLVYFDDGYAHERCCTLPIIGRRLHDQFGYVYEPEYKSLCCDQEQTDLLKAVDRITYVNEKIIEHRHWVTGVPKDALYLRNDALHDADKVTYERRKAMRREHYSQFGFDAPPLWLSICICSLPSRRSQLDRLLDHLWSQILSMQIGDNFPREVEILVDDREAISIGEKRQALIERAKAHFVCFVDDDDWVAHNYVWRILCALHSDPIADCAALSGVMTTAGQASEPFYNSIEYQEWYSKDGAHYRTPTHLSPVRRELALQAGFVPISHGEDFEYSRKLRPLLKREVLTGKAPLYFYLYWPKSKENV
jgi:hypothetical protein